VQDFFAFFEKNFSINWWR